MLDSSSGMVHQHILSTCHAIRSRYYLLLQLSENSVSIRLGQISPICNKEREAFSWFCAVKIHHKVAITKSYSKKKSNKCGYLEASLRAALSLNVECLTSSKLFVKLSQL